MFSRGIGPGMSEKLHNMPNNGGHAMKGHLWYTKGIVVDKLLTSQMHCQCAIIDNVILLKKMILDLSFMDSRQLFFKLLRK